MINPDALNFYIMQEYPYQIVWPNKSVNTAGHFSPTLA